MERMRKLEVGDVVMHLVNVADKKWNIGIVTNYKRHIGLYEVRWGDGETRNHTIELLKRIA